MVQKWNKSQTLFFHTVFIFIFTFSSPPPSFHTPSSVLVFLALSFYRPLLNSPLPLCSSSLSHAFTPSLRLSPTSSWLHLFLQLWLNAPFSSLLSSFLFYPLLTALRYWRLLAEFTKNKVIWDSWKQGKIYFLVPVIENRITASPVSLLSNF